MASDLTARVKRGGERRRKAPAAYSRGGAASEKTELGLPVADSSGGWVGRHLRGMRKPLVASGGGFEVSSVKLAEDGGSAAQGSPVLAGFGSYGAPWLRELAQKEDRDPGVFT